MKTVAGVVTLVLLLAGCAPTPHPTASGEPTGSPSPTPTLAAQPAPALPLSCAQLSTTAALTTHLHDAVSVKIDETQVGPDFSDLALLQAGGTECTWGSQDATDASYDTELVLQILPDAATEFAARTLPSYGPLVTGTLGSGSSYYCPSDGGGWCFGDLLAGDYWVHFEVGDADSPDGGPTGATVEAIMKPVASAVASAGGTARPWATPAKSFDEAALCSAPGAQALVSGAVGTAVTVGPATPNDDLLGVAAAREGVTGCVWSSGSDQLLGVEVLPGGGWLSSRIAAHPPAWILIGVGTAIDVPGSTVALAGCGDHCESLVGARNSLVHMNFGALQGPDGTSAATTITQKLIAGATS